MGSASVVSFMFCLSSCGLALLLSAGAGVQGAHGSFSPSNPPPASNFARCSANYESADLIMAGRPPSKSYPINNVTLLKFDDPYWKRYLKPPYCRRRCTATFSFTAHSQIPTNTAGSIELRRKGDLPCDNSRPRCTKRPTAIFFGQKVEAQRVSKHRPKNPGPPGTLTMYRMRVDKMNVSDYFNNPSQEVNVCKYRETVCTTSQPLDGHSLHP